MAKRTGRKMAKAGLAAVAVGAAELVLPGVAGAYSYGWTGNLPHGASGCYFYSNRGNCGPQRTDWNHVNGLYNSGPFYLNSIHLGFENAGAIRGIYLTQSTPTGTFYRSAGFGAGASVKPELTAISWTSGDSSVNGWYRAYT